MERKLRTEYRVVGDYWTFGGTVVVNGGCSKQVAKATAEGCTAYANPRVQSRVVSDWEDDERE